MENTVNNEMAAIAMHAHFIQIYNRVHQYLESSNTNYGARALGNLDTLVDILADAARNHSTIHTEALWNELEEIGALLMHHAVEVRLRQQPRRLSQIMISPRRITRFFGDESGRPIGTQPPHGTQANNASSTNTNHSTHIPSHSIVESESTNGVESAAPNNDSPWHLAETYIDELIHEMDEVQESGSNATKSPSNH